MKLRYLSLIIIYLLILTGTVFPQDFFSPENRLKFGSSLFEQKDYLRAAIEFEAYLKYNDKDTVRYNLARAYLEMEKYGQAEDNFKSLFSSLTLQNDAKFGVIKSLFFKGDYNSLRANALVSPYFSQDYEIPLRRIVNISYILDDKAKYDPAKIVSVFPADKQPALLEMLEQRMNPPYKSPLTAALLSAVIPGLGKAYAGEYTDGLIALAATGLSIYFAADSFNAGNNFKGWLFTGLSAFFYGGNIYGSAAAAQNYNAGIKFNLEKGLKLYFSANNYFLPKEKF